MKMMSTFKHPRVIPAWLGFNLPSKFPKGCSGTMVENKTWAKTSAIT